MKFGIFLTPFHRVGENPTLAIDRDMELIEWLDHLGYDEVWIGEHHSAGWELIASRNCPLLSASVPPPQSAWANVGTTFSPAGAAW
jgi:alkanesulfonate monooxygenase SsuD/methylene tetrahydromethanopterin reductase-like flavin-dependent oxidoreductase (luciferase family)